MGTGKHRVIAVFLACLVALAVAPAVAQDDRDLNAEIDALRQEMEALKQGQDAILKQLERLQRQGARAGNQSGAKRFTPTDVVIDGAPSMGDPDAKVVLVEFSDYQCPFCKRFAERTLPRLIEDYVETGKVRLVFLDFPLDSIHPAARSAAIAARCAGRQGKYWEMHDRMFLQQRALRRQPWPTMAEQLGLDTAAFDACMAEDGHDKRIKRDMANGYRAGVRGTPTFVLGTEVDGGTLKATELIRGARPYASFKQVIDRLLANSPS